jgi:hypothetical protein
VGKLMVQAEAKAREVTVRQQLADVIQSINTEIANHNATMAPLRLQRESLEGQLSYFSQQGDQADSDVAAPRNPDSVPSTSSSPSNSGISSPGWSPPQN